jgi:RNA polymerase sigma factor (sigma-70 family)
MPENSLVHLIPNLVRCRHEGVPDDELVDRYVREQDEGAFTELVRRHGPMVLSVCRRVLRNSADADDVFQAAFMVLARKAGSIRPAGSVGRWLHGVALRTAKEALRRAARRRAKESRVVPREEMPETALSDVRPILDAELARLPEQFAQVLILCDMEGRTRPEVAALLRVPEGTVASRLSRAREALAMRLTRRGIALTVGAVATVVSAEAGAATPPDLLAGTAKAAFAFGTGTVAQSTSPRALALANAVLGAAGVRFKLLVVGLVVMAAAVTGWAATTGTPTHQPPLPERVGAVVGPSPEQPPPPAPDPVVALRERLTGQWRVDEGVRDDRPLTDWEKGGFRFDFDASGVLRVHHGQVRGQRVFTWAIESAASPPVIALTPPDGKNGGAVRVSFEFRENALTLSWDEPEVGRRGPRVPGSNSTTCRVTLSKVVASAATELTVAPTPQNVVGSRLAGAWEIDGELSRKLGHDWAATGQPSKITLTFASDPAVAREVPDAYRELFASKRIYLAGRMTVAINGGEPASYRFLLIEHLGNAVLVDFVPHRGDEWSCEEAVTVMLAPGADREKDLLFLTAFETATHVPAGGYRRVTMNESPEGRGRVSSTPHASARRPPPQGGRLALNPISDHRPLSRYRFASSAERSAAGNWRAKSRVWG